MTATAVPYADQGLFPPCPIAGCTSITEVEGQPCQVCQELFGEYLTANPGGRSMTSEQVRQHKADTLDAYRTQGALADPEPPPALPDVTATLTELEQLRARLDARHVRKPAERKANQTCWCCDERRTCTRTPGGRWECDACAAEVTPGTTR